MQVELLAFKDFAALIKRKTLPYAAEIKRNLTFHGYSTMFGINYEIRKVAFVRRWIKRSGSCCANLCTNNQYINRFFRYDGNFTWGQTLDDGDITRIVEFGQCQFKGVDPVEARLRC